MHIYGVKGILCLSGYIDITSLPQQLFSDALNSLNACKSLFTSLCLLIQAEKSSGIPSQIATVLGFIINSLDMTVFLTTEKKTCLSVTKLCRVTRLRYETLPNVLGN